MPVNVYSTLDALAQRVHPTKPMRDVYAAFESTAMTHHGDSSLRCGHQPPDPDAEDPLFEVVKVQAMRMLHTGYWLYLTNEASWYRDSESRRWRFFSNGSECEVNADGVFLSEDDSRMVLDELLSHYEVDGDVKLPVYLPRFDSAPPALGEFHWSAPLRGAVWAATGDEFKVAKRCLTILASHNDR